MVVLMGKGLRWKLFTSDCYPLYEKDNIKPKHNIIFTKR